MLTNFQWAKYEKNTEVHSNNVLQKLKKKKHPININMKKV